MHGTHLNARRRHSLRPRNPAETTAHVCRLLYQFCQQPTFQPGSKVDVIRAVCLVRGHRCEAFGILGPESVHIGVHLPLGRNDEPTVDAIDDFNARAPSDRLTAYLGPHGVSLKVHLPSPVHGFVRVMGVFSELLAAADTMADVLASPARIGQLDLPLPGKPSTRLR